KIFGENDFAARFPSAVAAALTALCIFAWGSRLGSDRIGWWSAVVFSLSLQVVLHAKAAVADMWLVLFVTVAHWAGYQLLADYLTERNKRSTSNIQHPTSNEESSEAYSFCWWTFYCALA